MYEVDSPSVHLALAWLQESAAEPPIDETLPFLTDVRDALRSWKGETAAGICSINVDMLKVGSEAMIHWLPAVLPAVWEKNI